MRPPVSPDQPPSPIPGFKPRNRAVSGGGLFSRLALLSLAAFTGFSGCGAPGPGGYSAGGTYTVQRTYRTASTPYRQTPATILNPSQAPAVLHNPRWVRVHLLAGRDAFDLTVDGTVDILDGAGRLLERFDRLTPQPVTMTGTSLAIGNHIFYGVDRIEIKPTTATRCRIDDEDLGTSVRTLTVYRNAGERRLHCVAGWDVEDYLYGVLAGEVPVDWPAEALKAQAVASRTYVLYAMQDRRYEEYDVERTVSSQVFKTGDLRQIDPRVVAAVDATRGEYLTSNGVLFPAYFHSTCGGETAAAREVFGGEAAAALRGHNHETACSASAVYRWSRTFAVQEFETRLAKKGLWNRQADGAIENILPVGAAVYGQPMRATRFEIIGEKTRKFIPANDFRLAFGGGRNDLPSTLIARWVVRKGAIAIDGQGWGHGVGLCQFGAMGRAKTGENYRAILGFYYSGAELRRTESPGVLPGAADSADRAPKPAPDPA